MSPIVTTICPARHRMKDRSQILTLAAPCALVSLTIALALAAYIQTRPNTPGLAPGGEFDANRVCSAKNRIVPDFCTFQAATFSSRYS